MTPVRLEPAVLRSLVKYSTTEPLRSLEIICNYGQRSRTKQKRQLVYIEYDGQTLAKLAYSSTGPLSSSSSEVGVNVHQKWWQLSCHLLGVKLHLFCSAHVVRA